MSLIGYYTTSYSKLVSVFGEPNEEDGYKVSTEWGGLKTKCGIEFYLYDYKETKLYHDTLPSVEEFRNQSQYSWHIGGWNGEDDFVEKIIKYLNEELKN